MFQFQFSSPSKRRRPEQGEIVMRERCATPNGQNHTCRVNHVRSRGLAQHTLGGNQGRRGRMAGPTHIWIGGLGGGAIRRQRAGAAACTDDDPLLRAPLLLLEEKATNTAH